MNNQLRTGAPVKINGKIYPTVVDASRSIGVGTTALYAMVKELDKSKRSEITKTLKMPTQFTIEKIKPGNKQG